MREAANGCVQLQVFLFQVPSCQRRFQFSLSVLGLSMDHCIYFSAWFLLVCFGLGLAVVSSPVVDFLLGFDLCRLKNHLGRGHRTKVGWIFSSPIFEFLNEPLVCSICTCNSFRCRKFAHNVFSLELSVRFTSTQVLVIHVLWCFSLVLMSFLPNFNGKSVLLKKYCLCKYLKFQ